jgi:hypothetical protein
MTVEELAGGVWRWSASLGGDEVWCLYYETPAAIVLIDPVVPDEPERFFSALDRDVERLGVPVTIVCTSDERAAAAAELVARYGATLLRA